MIKLSQHELLTESFLDKVKSLAKGTLKGIGGAAGLAKGVAKIAAPNLSRVISGDIEKLKSIGASAKAGYRAVGSAVTSPQDRLVSELKARYYDSFNFDTIKYGKAEKNEVNKNVVTIPFEAVKKGGSQPEQFIGVIINRGSNNYDINIKGGNNTIIQPNSRSAKINFDNELLSWKGNKGITTDLKYSEIKEFLRDIIKIETGDLDEVLKDAGILPSATNIDQAKLTALRTMLKRFRLVERTQLDILEQLKLLH